MATVQSSEMSIRPFTPQDKEAVVQLSLRAWAPVFESIEQAMDPQVYRVLYPDWRVSQRAAVESVCTDTKHDVWVAEEDELPVGFVAIALHAKDSIGEIYMIAVDPSCQRAGVGTALTEYALSWIKESGMAVAMVATGGDPGHAPARRTYERSGFRMLPLAHFYKKL